MTKKKDTDVLAWHWLADNRKTQYDYPRVLVTPGLTLSLPKGERPVLCARGYHASLDPLDALRYARGSVICRVRMDGEIVYGDDKLVASSRTVLWMADATYALHVFACDVASRALMAAKERGERIDVRSVHAIAVKMKWLHGEATDEELHAARYAAEWAAESRAAASAVARNAASAVASVAARDSARDAASWDEAWAAAACADQRKRFLSFMESLAPEGMEQ